MNKHFISFLWLSLTLLASAWADTAKATDAVINTLSPARPRIGLVLGGGGARGAAHIGVLEVLEKLQIPIDCVAGTSMGALVAGAYAAGRSTAEMRTELARADWDDMFQDRPPYPEISYHNKTISRRFLQGLEIGTGETAISTSNGLVSGQKIKLFFNRLVYSDRGERTIESLGLPLSIIATDIGTGERIVFRNGSLTTAMRASMSVPGLMAPVDYNGRKLVDGGLVDNLPITEARERCQADRIIAVNVGSPLLAAEDVGSLLSVTVQMVNILTEQNVSRSRALLQEHDLYIRPDLTGISSGDFKKNSAAADRGHAAAEALVTQLKTLSVSAPEYAAWAAKKAFDVPAEPRIDEVQITGLHTVNPAVLERHLNIRAGDYIDSKRLDRDLLRTYGDGWYESVDYSIQAQRDRQILSILPVEKRWGPDYLRFGVNLDSNFHRDSSYTLRGAYDKTWLNSLGGQMLVVAEIGRTSGIGVDVYQPLEATQTFFSEGVAKISSDQVSLYQNTKKISAYDRNSREIALGGGINTGVLGQISAGWRRRWVNAQLDTGTPFAGFPENAKIDYSGGYAKLDFDQMDKLYFPSAGWAVKADYFKPLNQNYTRLAGELRGALSFNDYVLASKISYRGALKGNLPAYDAYSLGGFMNLSGLASAELYGDRMRYASVQMEKIIGRLPLLQTDMRAGIALETAHIGKLYTETHRANRINSWLAYLGGETFLGPVYLGYGRTTTGDSSVYLFIGTP